MHDFRLHYEQEVFVFWIVDSGLEVVARKFADGVSPKSLSTAISNACSLKAISNTSGSVLPAATSAI
jgi:hypothetical protein